MNELHTPRVMFLEPHVHTNQIVIEKSKTSVNDQRSEPKSRHVINGHETRKVQNTVDSSTDQPGPSRLDCAGDTSVQKIELQLTVARCSESKEVEKIVGSRNDHLLIEIQLKVLELLTCTRQFQQCIDHNDEYHNDDVRYRVRNNVKFHVLELITVSVFSSVRLENTSVCCC